MFQEISGLADPVQQAPIFIPYDRFEPAARPVLSGGWHGQASHECTRRELSRLVRLQNTATKEPGLWPRKN